MDFGDSDGDGKAEPGQELIYTLHLRNDSQADLTDVVVHDDISDVLEHGTLDEPPRWPRRASPSTPPTRGSRSWSGRSTGPVLPSGTAEATYTVTVGGRRLGRVAGQRGHPGGRRRLLQRGRRLHHDDGHPAGDDADAPQGRRPG